MSEPAWVALGAKTPVAYVGGWVAGTTYKSGDVVIYNGVQYMAVNPSTGSVPPALAAAPATPINVVTSLPASPFPGEECILVDSGTAPTYAWRFRYLSSITDTSKWLFIGGSPAVQRVDGIGVSPGTTYADLTGAFPTGPSITVPYNGIYWVDRMSIWTITSGATAPILSHSFAIGATAAVDADASTNNGDAAIPSKPVLKTLVAGTVLASKYKNTANAYNVTLRTISLLPVRIG